jgi:phage-related protein
MPQNTKPMRKPLFWLGSSLADLKTFPREVMAEIGKALSVAQLGGKSLDAKPLKSLGPGVIEIVDDHDGNTYRAIYAVRFPEGIYVVHAFQKKSTKGIATPKREIELIKARLKTLEAQRAAEKKKDKI